MNLEKCGSKDPKPPFINKTSKVSSWFQMLNLHPARLWDSCKLTDEELVFGHLLNF